MNNARFACRRVRATVPERTRSRFRSRFRFRFRFRSQHASKRKDKDPEDSDADVDYDDMDANDFEDAEFDDAAADMDFGAGLTNSLVRAQIVISTRSLAALRSCELVGIRRRRVRI